MSTVILELFTHGGAQVATHRLDTHHVPRVGEVVESLQNADDLKGVSTLLVVDVVHRLEQGTLTPVLRCWESANPADDRLLCLREYGWLAPQTDAPAAAPNQ